jgi:hypothetical protein
VCLCLAVAAEQEEEERRGGRARRGGRGDSWRSGDEERREKADFCLGMRVSGWPAAFCSSRLWGYYWTGCSSLCVRKMKICPRLHKPLEIVLALLIASRS